MSDGWKERDDRTIHIGRLPAAVKRKEDVAEAFVEFGSITHIHIQADLKFGFVHFEDEHSAIAALERQSVELLGGRVEIRTALNKRTKRPHADLVGDAPSEADLLADEEDYVADDASEECPSEGAGQDSEASDNEALPPEADPLLEFWSERCALPGTDSNITGDGAPESREILEERLQALRVACIHTLDTHSGQMMLNELGQDELIMDQKSSLPRISLLKVIQAFPDNFGAEDKGNGQYLVTLISSDDGDTSKLEELATELSRGRHSGKEQTKARPVDAHKATVVAGLLSDGWKERDERTVYIGRLPDAVRTKDDILSAFERQFGRVTHVHIQKDLQFGFVHFEVVDSAVAAIRARLVDVCGSSVEVRTASQHGPAAKRRGGDHPAARGALPAHGADGEQRAPRGGPRWGADRPRSREPPSAAPRRPSPDRGRPRGEAPAGQWKGRSKGSARELEPEADPPPPSRPPPRPVSRQLDGPRPPAAAPPQEAKKVFYPKAVDLQSTRRAPSAAGPPKPSMAPHLEEQRAAKLAKPAPPQSWPSASSARPRMALPMPSPSAASKSAPDKRVPLPLPAKAPHPRPTSEAAMDARGRKRGRSPG